MNHISLILIALMMLAITIMMSPGVLALNHGKVLQTIALWLAIFLGLALIYKNFGPDSPHPLFQLPEAMAPQLPTATPQPPAENSKQPGTGI